MPICPLCATEAKLSNYPVSDGPAGASIDICRPCKTQINGELQPNFWRCLGTAMWSEDDAVKVVSYRLLARLHTEDWARDLLDMFYADDDTLAWARAGVVNAALEITHRDSNGVVLASGDTVVLVKDLNVKGAGFTAKRGTAVRGISLVDDNAAQIEGRVEGQRIVILTEFVKKR